MRCTPTLEDLEVDAWNVRVDSVEDKHSAGEGADAARAVVGGTVCRDGFRRRLRALPASTSFSKTTHEAIDGPLGQRAGGAGGGVVPGKLSIRFMVGDDEMCAAVNCSAGDDEVVQIEAEASGSGGVAPVPKWDTLSDFGKVRGGSMLKPPICCTPTDTLLQASRYAARDALTCCHHP